MLLLGCEAGGRMVMEELHAYVPYLVFVPYSMHLWKT